jgi:hypothetical protein
VALWPDFPAHRWVETGASPNPSKAVEVDIAIHILDNRPLVSSAKIGLATATPLGTEALHRANHSRVAPLWLWWHRQIRFL